jgi:hypothetical protein
MLFFSHRELIHVGEGNIYLRNGEVDMTINYYEKALSMGGKE